MLSLAYVSRPTVWPKPREEILVDIQVVSIARNTQFEITGLLISTLAHFAQVLEGPAKAVDSIMASIMLDPRHYDIVVVRRTQLLRRRFPHWRMARFEYESIADASLTPLLVELHAEAGGAALRRFDRFVDALARSHGKPLD